MSDVHIPEIIKTQIQVREEELRRKSSLEEAK